MAGADVAILLALGAALVSAIGSVIRQRSAHEIVVKPVGAWELFCLSLRDTRWWLGAVGNPTSDQQRASLETWVVVTLVMGPALVLCVLGARIWSGAVAAVLLAVVAGSSLALFAVLTKGAVEASHGGLGALLHAPELYALLAVALAGMVFQQASFRAGALTASLPTMTLAKPLVGWILGITVLSEDLRVDNEKVFVLVAAVIVMVVSTVALARGEAAGMEAFGRRRSKAAGQPLAPSER
jgi:hypothetical protein